MLIFKQNVHIYPSQTSTSQGKPFSFTNTTGRETIRDKILLVMHGVLSPGRWEVIGLPDGGFILQNLVEGRRLQGESIIF